MIIAVVIVISIIIIILVVIITLLINAHRPDLVKFLVYGTNSPLIFASLVRHSLFHFHLLRMVVHRLHHLHFHHFHLLLLIQSFHSQTWLFGKSFPPQTFSSPTGPIPRTLRPFNVFTLLNSWIRLHSVLMH